MAKREPYQDEIAPSLLYEGENLSREYYGNLKALADAINDNQWVSPLVVVKEGKRYRIVAGYRRFRAIGILIERGDWDKDQGIPCQVYTTLSDAGAAMLNSAENQHRLAPNYFELFTNCRQLKERFGFSSDTIAKRLNKSTAHVNNYIRCARQLHPAILKSLSFMGEKEPPMKLNGLFELASKPQEEQLKQWQNATSVTPNVRGMRQEDGEERTKAKRRTELKHAIKELKRIGDDECMFGARVLEWALGEREQPPWDT